MERQPMCTVVFVPRPRGGYLLGHNRDESVRRARGLPPRRSRRRGRTLLAPSDPDGGGTWIGVNDAGITVCMLNAAHRDPSRLPSAPRSRGLVALEALGSGSIVELGAWLETHVEEFRSMRAFHLVAAEPGTLRKSARAARFRWDGVRARFDLHADPSLFVSSGFDQAAAERARGREWRALLRTERPPGPEILAAWLESHAPERGALSVCMHRPEARTVSRTIVAVDASGAEMRYRDGQPCSPDGTDSVLRIRRRA